MKLQYTNNSGETATRSLDKNETVLVGRSKDAEIHTTNPSVSRKHGQFSYEGGKWQVRDLGSSNGNFVNDVATDQATLSVDDCVKFGDFEVLFLQGTSKEAKPTPANDPYGFDQRIDEASAKKKPAAKPAPKPAPKQAAKPAPKPVPVEKPTKKPTPKRAKAEEPAEERARVVRRDEPKADPEAAKRLAALEKEHKRLSESKQEREDKYVEQIKQQGAEIESLSQIIKEQKSSMSDLELRNEELETRSTRYEVELDSITEKYVQIKDQLTLQKQLLEEAREEAADKDDRVFQLESQSSDLESELSAAQDKASDINDQVAALKIKVTQKDRQLEELQRQYDLMEFELRSNKEELQSLQEGFNNDAGDTQKLERRISQLREIIADKENVISELRVDLENKDLEIRQARMGSGMEDLAEEKAKLLQDYYDKNRDVDNLTDELRESKFQQNELQEKVNELTATAERRGKAEENIDVTAHPDFKAKMREFQRLEEQMEDLQRQLESAQEQLESASSTEGDSKKLKSENTSLKRKLTNAEKKVGQLTDELATATEQGSSKEVSGKDSAETSAGVDKLQSKLNTELEIVDEMFAQWRGNFSLFKTNLTALVALVRAVADADDVPAAIADAMSTHNSVDSADTVEDLIRVVSADSAALKKGLTRIKKALDK